MDVNLRSLIGKLNTTTRNTTEAAAGLCLARTHYNVEIEHYLFKLLDVTDGDFTTIAKHAEMDKGRFATDLMRALDRFKTGNGRTPALSPDFVQTMTEAWTVDIPKRLLWSLLDSIDCRRRPRRRFEDLTAPLGPRRSPGSR